MARGELLVDVEDRFGDGGPGEALGAFAGVGTEAVTEGRIGEDAGEVVGEEAGVADGGEEAGRAVLDGEGETAGAGGDDRASAGHGLDGDEAERFVARGDY